MQYFIGIVPPDNYKEQIIKFQKKWKGNTLPDLVEPHITLKAQGGLTADERWINQVKIVCSNFPSFKVAIDKPMFFGDEILYLSANSNELKELHEQLVQVISPSKDLIKKYFELDDFVPHMTLAKTYYGLSSEDLKEMAKMAEEELSPYPTYEVNFIRIYVENSKLKKYETYLDIPLKD
ncbi:2'-5' RNA ligase [Lottiidibacillus patelloidae]|uniref:2'-5' RNA ligase n=1 Tax=Lottiidibacillus patelloidae TaxID=2670334 RepID=A0A263BV62_9BACI|nr:2'-5' RNA ligase family protein [Lottiidibacillus patelloidae]OZM57585.1 2'-5' RNA ligase [Lottiidibacillus patelloidae]